MIYILFLVFTLFILCFALYQWQYFMIFTPVYYRKDGTCERCEYVSIKTDDGIELEGVVYEPSHPKATLLFFGGRSDDSVALIHKLAQNYSQLRVITFNYRSYGKSGGEASEANLLKDSLHIAALVEKHYGSFYVMGFSLGSSVAAYLASKHATNGVFLVGAFDSISSLVKQKYGIGVPPLCLRYKFNTQGYIQRVKEGVCLFVSKADTITYIENARNLKKAIPNLACYVEFDDLSHKELLCNTQVAQKINKVIDEQSASV